jgi:hypothetical protein
MRWPTIVVIFAAAPWDASAQDMPLSQVLIEGEEWRTIDRGLERVYSLRSQPGGETYVIHSKGLRKISPHGDVTAVSGEARSVPALGKTVFASNRFVYGASPSRRIIFTMSPEAPRDASPRHIRIDGLTAPSGAAVSSDGGTLFVGDADGRFIWAFRLDKDGELSAGQPFAPLRLAQGEATSRVGDLATDASGRIYAATPLGVQVFDPIGRLCGVLTNPAREPLVAVAFGGTDGRLLLVASRTTIYARKVAAQGLGFDKPK